MTRTLTWASYNKPTSITAGATTETFLYGPSRERLQTTVTGSSGSVTTTYRHYVIAGGARVGVETIATTSGTVTSDSLSFYVHDQVGGVIATVTEGLYGANQQLTVYSHDPWGKARPTSGAGANSSLPSGTFLSDSAVMAGQHEGFAGHEDLEDIGIVDMEGRIYDPEVGRFLSADPTVEYPESSQGYNRYTYCNNNPLSLSDPTGYFDFNTVAAVAVVAVVDYFCYGACSGVNYEFLSGAAAGYIGSGGNWQSTVMGGLLRRFTPLPTGLWKVDAGRPVRA